jgi:hypothetical protein
VHPLPGNPFILGCRIPQSQISVPQDLGTWGFGAPGTGMLLHKEPGRVQDIQGLQISQECSDFRAFAPLALGFCYMAKCRTITGCRKLGKCLSLWAP